MPDRYYDCTYGYIYFTIIFYIVLTFWLCLLIRSFYFFVKGTPKSVRDRSYFRVRSDLEMESEDYFYFWRNVKERPPRHEKKMVWWRLPWVIFFFIYSYYFCYKCIYISLVEYWSIDLELFYDFFFLPTIFYYILLWINYLYYYHAFLYKEWYDVSLFFISIPLWRCTECDHVRVLMFVQPWYVYFLRWLFFTPVYIVIVDLIFFFGYP